MQASAVAVGCWTLASSLAVNDRGPLVPQAASEAAESRFRKSRRTMERGAVGSIEKVISVAIRGGMALPVSVGLTLSF